jgi:hypothetical protein
MTEQEVRAAIARSLYWRFMKDTTGEPGKWADLDEEHRKVWRGVAKSAIRRIGELVQQGALSLPVTRESE